MKNQPSIIIFARELVPYCNSVGSSLRAITLSAFLADTGFNVKVIGAKGSFISNFGLEKYLAKLNIAYKNDLLQNFYTKKALSIESKPFEGKQSSFIKSAINKIKVDVKPYIVPDVAIIFLPKYIFFVLYECVIRKPNYLLVSSPPHSSQLIILFIKIFGPKKIKLIVDYRDGWNTFNIFQMKNKILSRLSESIEIAVLNSCDIFIYQSPKVLEDINHKYRIGDSLIKKSLLMRNGYTNIEAPIQNKDQFEGLLKNDCFNLGYFGNIDYSIGGWRDPTPLLSDLDNLGFKINFVTFGLQSKNPPWKKFKNITIHHNPTIDLFSAKTAMKKFDSLFVFHSSKTGAEEVIPGKFYEYIQSNIPIFVYGPPDMECGRMVEEYSFGIFIKSCDLIRVVEEKFKLLLDDNFISQCKQSLFQKQNLFSRESQYSKLVKRLLSRD